MITKNTHRKRLVVAIIHHVIRSPEREREEEQKRKAERHIQRERAVFAHWIDRRPLFRRERARDVSLSLSLFSHTWTKEEFRVIWQFAQQREVETTSDDDDDEDDMVIISPPSLRSKERGKQRTYI
jgi:hypothetical protein|tara:strand:+ start:4668 stop:5045 length:378 start_codon:yes stop_codon:yes gene_type:complete